MLGKDMHELIHHHTCEGDEYPVEDCPIYQASKTGEGSHVNDEVLWRKDGTCFDAEYWSYPMFADGQCIGAVVTFLDITARRKAEVKIQESKKRLADAQALAHVANWEWDIKNDHLLWSDEVYRIFGMQPQQIKASYAIFLERVHEDDRQNVIDAINCSLEHPEQEYKIEHRIVQPGGEIRWVYETGEIRYENSRPVEMTGIVHDVTERKKAELIVKAYQEDLEKKVKERTLELSEANAQLQQLDHLKSMFIASMSHELRTPLNSIIGFTGVMLKGMTGELNDLQSEQLGRVQFSARHLLALISDIIDISRIEAGRVDVGVEDVDLNDVLQGALSDVNRMMDLRGNKVITKLVPDITLSSDRLRLSQVFLNLFSNAAKYTEKGTVSIQTREYDDQVEIEVKDTGVGISESNMNKLFLPFERFNNYLSVRSGGTGLGLYLTKKLLDEVLQGSITVESEPDKGSRFVVILPRKLELEKVNNGNVRMMA